MYNEFGEGFLSHSEGYKEFYGLKWWLFMSQVDSDPIFFNIIFSLVDNGIKGVTQPPGWKIPYTVHFDWLPDTQKRITFGFFCPGDGPCSQELIEVPTMLFGQELYELCPF